MEINSRNTEVTSSWITYKKAAVVGGIGVGVLALSGVTLTILFKSSVASTLHATLLHNSLLGRCIGYGSLGLGSILLIGGIAIAIKTPPPKREPPYLLPNEEPGERYKQAHVPFVNSDPFLDYKTDFLERLRSLRKRGDLHSDLIKPVEILANETEELAKLCADNLQILLEIYSNALGELKNLEQINSALNSSETENVAALIQDVNFTHKALESLGKNNLSEFDALINADNVNTRIKLPLDGTLLHHIAKKGTPIGAVAILARKGANFTMLDKWGNTPLLWALANAQNSIAMELIRYGQPESLNTQDTQDNHNAPLHLAVGKGYVFHDKGGKMLEFTNTQLVEQLLKANANPNLQNREGNTPLHLAYLRRDKVMIELLLRAGARSDIQNKNGELPAGMASKSYEEACRILDTTVYVYLLDRKPFN